MEYPDICRQSEWQEMAEDIRNSKQPDLEKVVHAFGWVTRRIVEQGLKDIELARALRDDDSVVKNQIKTEAIRHARSVFQVCHMLATGRRAWDE
jgi:hypothetical protein